MPAKAKGLDSPGVWASLLGDRPVQIFAQYSAQRLPSCLCLLVAPHTVAALCLIFAATTPLRTSRQPACKNIPSPAPLPTPRPSSCPHFLAARGGGDPCDQHQHRKLG